MKILFISDIHGITNNLDYINKLDKIDKFDKIVVLGDLYYSGPNYNNEHIQNSKQVLEFLLYYKNKLICLRGNCDSDVDIKSSDFPICNNLVLINTDDINIFCTHGNEYNKDKNNKFTQKGILIYGHEHIPYVYKEDEMIYICVGSISLPRDNNKPTYAIYENKKITIYTITNETIAEVIV